MPQDLIIELRNAQRSTAVDTRGLKRFARIALELSSTLKRRACDLSSLHQILIVLVSDARMVKLHENFCGPHTPTDVLTFRHGEIVISIDTARRQAALLGTTIGYELRLYIVHGLLHLCGFDDRQARTRFQMRRVQSGLLRRALAIERRALRVSFEDGSVGRRPKYRGASRAIRRGS